MFNKNSLPGNQPAFIKNIVTISCIVCCLCFTGPVTAQQIKDTVLNKAILPTLIPGSDGIDASDLLHQGFKSHKQLTADTLIAKPKKFYTSIFPAAGYTLQTGFAVLISGSFAFYVDTASKKLSNILTNFTYTQFNQILFPLSASIWTKDNRYIILADYRYLKYPSITYGLGSNTVQSEAYTLNFNYIKLHQSILKKVYRNLYAGAGLYYDRLWNIREIDPPTGVITSFQKYGSQKTATAVAIALKVLYDNRQNQINPTNGAYASIVFRPNYTFLGSDANWKSLQIDFRKYIKINGNPRSILALWSFDWLTLTGKPPYLLLPSTGWDDQYNTGRGYIQSRFRAKNLIYTEAEYRFGITENGLLGGVVFANTQSYSRKFTTQQFVRVAAGFGAGLRIKLNKHSNTNLAIDYGFGQQGSKGLFLNLGEVF